MDVSYKFYSVNGKVLSAGEPVPSERIDGTVEMSHPGVWVPGETDDAQRAAGAGIVVSMPGRKARAMVRPARVHLGLFRLQREYATAGA
jgi:hypothetical protein